LPLEGSDYKVSIHLVIQTLFSRRSFLKSLSRSALVLAFDDVLSAAMPLQTARPAANPTSAPGVSFVNIAREAGLNAKTIYGGEKKNKYLLETTGCGVAFYDYDHDGWLDIFIVNGWRLEGFPKGQEPICHLFKNNRDGTFTDVTLRAGVAKSGWGQGVCIGDYDNDGHDDLFISYFGKNVLFHNNGDGTFTDVSERSGVAGRAGRWNTGCAFVDYDRDGYLDLFIANYIDMDLENAPTPDSGSCLYKSIQVACGPPGLQGGKNILLRNNRNGTFTDVSEKAGILSANGTYGLGVLTSDFNNDGWPDIYVANDSTASSLYRNEKNGTFTDISIEAGAAFSPDGKPQAGMGVGAGDYDHDGNLDILKTNFAGDTHSLYRNEGKDSFEDTTFTAGLGLNTRYLGWGCGFIDIDNDGWVDALVINGHVYPEVEKLKTEAAYQQRKLLYRNLHNGKFEDISMKAGAGISANAAGRGCAFGDFDNDGDVDVVVNVVNGMPELLRCDAQTRNNWIKVKTVGVKSNRSGIGARVRCVAKNGKEVLEQVDEVRSGGSYFSQNDLRLHFGLAKSERVELLEVRWPSGQVDTFKDLPINQMIIVKEDDPKYSTQRWGQK
jgi:enediyne biosynthesis protein E4